jgi:hypothetical protein
MFVPLPLFHLMQKTPHYDKEFRIVTKSEIRHCILGNNMVSFYMIIVHKIGIEVYCYYYRFSILAGGRGRGGTEILIVNR